jgi:hypothetical protein
MHREISDAGMHRNRWLDEYRMGAAHLSNTHSQQAEQTHGS